ncbi:hypothetical protein MLD38_034805 [Melastoma candidum]|uniref:Uncharacterized protein n=1 Tax=Melastoma candidum TaxID=119954 RepID=A0ACB9MD29_9MYRT|nr:hypothetical protein MLD38_034805 [Melastoma candidum]
MSYCTGCLIIFLGIGKNKGRVIFKGPPFSTVFVQEFCESRQNSKKYSLSLESGGEAVPPFSPPISQPRRYLSFRVSAAPPLLPVSVSIVGVVWTPCNAEYLRPPPPSVHRFSPRTSFGSRLHR